jgi:hypothetical protein
MKPPPHDHLKLSVKSALLLAFFTLASCAKLAGMLGLTPWYLERRITAELPALRAEQRQQLKAEINRYWQWNRAKMMPEYSKALRGIAEQLTSTAGLDVERAGEGLSRLYADTLEPAFKPSTQLLRSFDTAQIDALEKKQKESQAKKREQYLGDPAAALERRQKRLLKTLQDWAGPLNAGQQQRLRELVQGFPMPYEAWLKDRERREAALIQALRQKRSEAEVEALLRANWRSSGKEKGAFEWDEKGLRRHSKDIVELLTPAQKAHLAGKLVEVAVKMDDLAG